MQNLIDTFFFYLPKAILYFTFGFFILQIITFYKKQNQPNFQLVKWFIISFGVINILKICYNLFNGNFLDDTFLNRLNGDYWWTYWMMMISQTILPLSLLIKKLGNNIYYMLALTILINIGWLFELFVILIALKRDNL